MGSNKAYKKPKPKNSDDNDDSKYIKISKFHFYTAIVVLIVSLVIYNSNKGHVIKSEHIIFFP